MFDEGVGRVYVRAAVGDTQRLEKQRESPEAKGGGSRGGMIVISPKNLGSQFLWGALRGGLALGTVDYYDALENFEG